ncbi:MAG: glycosyltransferase family 2 protein [Elusimicrobia bacterium]|nr:glycosyltransferase family 2 protein [Elusimicrobiota bacterium]
MGQELSHPTIEDKGLISVVLPAYNEETTLAREIDNIRSIMEKTPYPFEFIVVDDGSKDKTAEVAASKNVRLLRHKENRGVGAARKTGIYEARGEIIVTSDADGTYPHEDIPKLLECFPDCDMAIGARTLVVQEPFYRLWPKNTIRLLASKLSGVNIEDLNTGLRAFKKSAAVRYFSLLPEGHSWESTITLAFLCNGHPVRFVPINYFKRKGGHSSFHPIKDTYSMILLVIRTVMYFNPLRVLLPVSAFFVGASLIKMYYDLMVYRIIGGFDVSLCLTGVLIGICGFLADLLILLHKKSPPKI